MISPPGPSPGLSSPGFSPPGLSADAAGWSLGSLRTAALTSAAASPSALKPGPGHRVQPSSSLTAMLSHLSRRTLYFFSMFFNGLVFNITGIMFGIKWQNTQHEHFNPWGRGNKATDICSSETPLCHRYNISLTN